MRMIAVLVALAALLSLSTPAYADHVSVAIKEGYVWFEEHDKSPFPHNTIMDNEWTGGGGYVRYDFKDKFFARLDYDQVRSGNTFQSQPKNIPYEGVRYTIRHIIAYGGWKPWKGLYFAAGPGIGLHTINVETFQAHPIDIDFHPTLALSVLAGYEQSLYKGFYAFSEVRGLYDRQEIALKGKNTSQRDTIKEDFSNIGLFAGVGFKF